MNLPRVIFSSGVSLLLICLVTGFLPTWDGSWRPWLLSWATVHAVMFGGGLIAVVVGVFEGGAPWLRR